MAALNPLSIKYLRLLDALPVAEEVGVFHNENTIVLSDMRPYHTHGENRSVAHPESMIKHLECFEPFTGPLF